MAASAESLVHIIFHHHHAEPIKVRSQRRKNQGSKRRRNYYRRACVPAGGRRAWGGRRPALLVAAAAAQDGKKQHLACCAAPHRTARSAHPVELVVGRLLLPPGVATHCPPHTATTRKRLQPVRPATPDRPIALRAVGHRQVPLVCLVRRDPPERDVAVRRHLARGDALEHEAARVGKLHLARSGRGVRRRARGELRELLLDVLEPAEMGRRKRAWVVRVRFPVNDQVLRDPSLIGTETPGWLPLAGKGVCPSSFCFAPDVSVHSGQGVRAEEAALRLGPVDAAALDGDVHNAVGALRGLVCRNGGRDGNERHGRVWQLCELRSVCRAKGVRWEEATGVAS